jgi:TonB family protein
VNLPSIPAAPNVDSIVGSATERSPVRDTDRIGTEVRLPHPTSADVDDVATPPKIIGRAPAPRFPDALLHSTRPEGEVVVRFMVNELGIVDVGSMTVLQSDHELFTAAVRDILPRFRFEPARTHAPESKPVAAWVTVPFRFAAKR